MRLLRCIAKAVVNNGLKALVSVVPLGVVLYEIAEDVCRRLREPAPGPAAAPEAVLPAEIQALAQAPADQVRQEVAAAVQEAAADQPAAVQAALTSYLTQVPAMIRRVSRRPSDPSGTTLPAGLSLRKPADLVPFLPPKLPRFRPGDRPLPGVNWELEELLGVGGFGEVWKARHPSLTGITAALKFCLDAETGKSLRHEAAALNRVMQAGRHPGIVPLRQAYLDNNPVCLEYEYVEGGDLGGLIQEMHQSGKVAVADVARWMLHLVVTVRFAHEMKPQPLVHRDLKPANILVQRSPDGKFSLRVADFGISGLAATQALDEAARTPTSQSSLLATVARGSYTPLYASPQQQRGEPADPRDDVHALGVIWYQMLTGDLAQGLASDWRDELAERSVPGATIDLLGRCVAGRLERRLADAGELARQLESLLQASTPASGRRQAPESPTRPESADDLAAQVERTMQRVRQAHADAKQKAEREHDYAAAASLLESVPEHLRDGALYTAVCGQSDRATLLDREVRAAVQAMRLGGLRPKVQELLQLLPRRMDLQRLLATLPEELVREIVNSIGMKLALIPAGKFLMGSPASEAERSADEGPQHKVEITRPFYLGLHPVTVSTFRLFVQRSGYKTEAEKSGGAHRWTGKKWELDPTTNWLKPGFKQSEAHPVSCVSWNDAQAFCKWLREVETERAYRLPTEAEWEYACRGEATSSKPFHFGDSLSSAQANFDGNYPYGRALKGQYLESTTAVGCYPPNVFGLYDMYGNVWEWCSDWYGAFTSQPLKDPPGPTTGQRRVLRGGSWHGSGRHCRSAFRTGSVPCNRYAGIGFRVVSFARA